MPTFVMKAERARDHLEHEGPVSISRNDWHENCTEASLGTSIRTDEIIDSTRKECSFETGEQGLACSGVDNWIFFPSDFPEIVGDEHLV